jgi:hypothetical protein
MGEKCFYYFVLSYNPTYLNNDEVYISKVHHVKSLDDNSKLPPLSCGKFKQKIYNLKNIVVKIGV